MNRVTSSLAGLLVAGVVLAACGDDRELVGLTRDPAPQVDAVTLPDVSNGGEPFEFRAADGGLLVVYFGYTNCPDVCPTTMADLRTALGDIGDDADRVDVAMVTIDPDRDTPVLTDYVQSFVPDAQVVDGFSVKMPQNQLTDEEIAKVVAYIVALNEPAPTGTGG